MTDYKYVHFMPTAQLQYSGCRKLNIDIWPNNIKMFRVSAGEYEKDINTVNPLGMKGQLASAFAQMISALWSGTCQSFAPTKIKVNYC